MIKAVIFDIGGVLSRFVRSDNRSRWERRLGLPEGGLERAIFHNPLAARGFIGQASDEEVWEDFRLRFNLTSQDIVDLYQEFWQDAEWDTVLFDYIRGLRPRYRTGVISDALPGARHEARVKANVNYDLFDVVLISGEEGVLKPDAAIFDRALAALGVERGEAVFVDDNPRIIDGANALGIHGVLSVTSEQTLADIDRLLAVK
jgi:FMN phosphatase YigB (HAD superfamily)